MHYLHSKHITPKDAQMDIVYASTSLINSRGERREVPGFSGSIPQLVPFGFQL